MSNKNKAKKGPVIEELQTAQNPVAVEQAGAGKKPTLPREINGPRGLEPTRYGDWESKGRCHDF